jgi:hypothetical protein
MDTASLVAIGGTALNLLLSYLKSAGKGAANKAGEEVYETLKTYAIKRPPLRNRLAQMKTDPSNTDLQAELRSQIIELMAQDNSFLQALQTALTAAERNSGQKTVITMKAGNEAIQIGQNSGPITLNRK